MSRRLEITFVDKSDEPIAVEFDAYSGLSSARRHLLGSGRSKNGHVGLTVPDAVDALHLELKRAWRDEVHDFDLSEDLDEVVSKRISLRAPRVALVLSGGGFRATLFHLGVVSYLQATGHLSEVVYVAGVSGGALMAAHLVTNWAEYLKPVEFVSAELRRLIADGFRRTSRADGVPSEAFVQLVSRFFANDDKEFTLSRLRGAPYLALFATETTDPGIIAFTKKGGLRLPSRISSDTAIELVADEQYDVGRAVACSAAFPGYFRPIALQPLGASEGGHTARLVQDGGLLDNTGLDGTMRLQDLAADPLLSDLPSFDYVLFSDAGKLLQTAASDQNRREIPGGVRSVRVAMDASREHVIAAARARWAPRNLGEISIGGASSGGQPDVGYAEATARLVAMVRTDLDAFPKLLHQVIGHHGYARAHSVFSAVHMRAPRAATLFSTRPEIAQAALDPMLREAGGVRLLDAPSFWAFATGSWQWW